MGSPGVPGSGIGKAIESALGVLSGERLRYIGRATDLVWLGIGRDVETVDRHGGIRLVAEHALHLQCPWRLTRLGVPLVGSWDVHRSIGSNEFADGELLQGEAAFDPIAAELTAEAGEEEQHVNRLTGDDWGGLVLEFTSGLMLDVLPVTTASDECWRYLQLGDDTEHFVVFETPEG
ncbi:MAG: hypothetical protein AVDCRST_MAG87-2878 [uncultured Thermomicrobiales bacterium]|uniref:Uncharacterized protein n=1 Tax=uncultured Thermomicrobiales bacterium TaxID=1645740 RepID=A0A6J4VFU6_9BACT|nr:MAG: hypothetical protein AVDCRST_MAG87-2878 [uncultured Thermomicrobiales bacterium]